MFGGEISDSSRTTHRSCSLASIGGNMQAIVVRARHDNGPGDILQELSDLLKGLWYSEADTGP